MQFLKGKFQDRHFPTNITQIPFEPFEHREDILHGDTIRSKENNNHRITFSCKYNYGMPIHNLLEENWGILSRNDTTKRKLLPKEIRVSYKHGKNIKEKLVRAKIKGQTKANFDRQSIPNIVIPGFPAKNILCRQTMCGTCNQLTQRNTYYSYQTKECYEIKEIFSCNTKGAIYLLDCKICGKQYVGETGTTVRERMKHHRNAVTANVNRPIYAHLTKHQKNLTVSTLQLSTRSPT